jgi:hypothetical protein
MADSTPEEAGAAMAITRDLVGGVHASKERVARIAAAVASGGGDVHQTGASRAPSS